MWVFELIWEVILKFIFKDLIIDSIGEFSPKASVWFWIVIAMILCAIVGTIIFLSL